MDPPDPNGASGRSRDEGDRLDSWKEIAAYLGRSVTTLQRWEAGEGLPVRRLAHAKKGSVFALKHELDAWAHRRTSGPPALEESIPTPRDTGWVPRWMVPRVGLLVWTAISAVVLALAIVVLGVTWALAKMEGAVPRTPTNFVARSPEPGTVILLWVDASSNEDRFEISRSSTIVGSVQHGFTTAEFRSLDAGTSYAWDVRACNSNGCSPWHGVVGQTPDGSAAFTGTPDLPATGGETDILFVSSRATGRSQIYVMKDDGSGATRVTNSSANDSDPAWSPDRSRIAFASDRTGASEVYLVNADGSNVVNLTNHDPANDYAPAWSPDGKRIAFVSTRAGDADVWVMSADADGSDPVDLTKSQGNDVHPSWSPDGQRIAFCSSRNGAPAIYVMDVNGSNQRRVTTDGAANQSPAWGPDVRIAFQSARDGNEEIYVIDADGSHETRVTRHPGHDEAPSWSPDGGLIVFVSNRDGNNGVYSIRPDGSGLNNLTRAPASSSAPAWGLLRK